MIIFPFRIDGFRWIKFTVHDFALRLWVMKNVRKIGCHFTRLKGIYKISFTAAIQQSHLQTQPHPAPKSRKNHICKAADSWPSLYIFHYKRCSLRNGSRKFFDSFLAATSCISLKDLTRSFRRDLPASKKRRGIVLRLFLL